MNLESSPPKSNIEVVDDNEEIEEATEVKADPLSAVTDSSDESDDDTVCSSASLAAAKLNETYIKEHTPEREPCEMVRLTGTGSENDKPVAGQSQQQAKPEKKSKLSKLSNMIKRKPKEKDPAC